jgi:hypothetical protein
VERGADGDSNVTKRKNQPILCWCTFVPAVPVYKGDRRNVQGYVLTKRLIVIDGEDNRDLSSLNVFRKPLVVKPDCRCVTDCKVLRGTPSLGLQFWLTLPVLLP